MKKHNNYKRNTNYGRNIRDKDQQTKFSFRNQRLASVAILFSVLFFSLRTSYNLLMPKFDIIAVDNIFNLDQILTALIIGYIIYAILWLLLYGFFEFFNFIKFKSRAVKNRFNKRADDLYKYFLANIFITVFWLFDAIFIIQFFETVNLINLLLVLLYNGILIYFYRTQTDILNEIIDDKRNVFLVLIFWIGLSFLVILGGFLLNDNLNASGYEFHFNSESDIEILFENKFPEEVKIVILDGEDISYDMNLNKNDFNIYSKNYIKSVDFNKIHLFDSGKSESIYYYNLDLSQKLVEGVNTLKIIFKENSFNSDFEVRVRNDIIKKENKVKFIKDHITSNN